MYLEKINGPQDVKKLNSRERIALAAEMRAALLKRLSAHGGHFGPNFGIVEATIALHTVFDSPRDKIVFDVSHQCYPHKMLTGRKDAYLDGDKYDDVSGFSNPQESEHDFFVIGHTSTSVSLACGLAKARDLAGGRENVIAVIGDGSLSGGEALEGLDFAGEMKSNLIIVVNDNGMSIAENHGGIYKNLRELRESNGKCAVNLFRAMGLDYVYVGDGNDIDALIAAFASVKGAPKPVVVHIVTQKGKGYRLAEENKENWHYVAPFDAATGRPQYAAGGEEYDTLTADYLLEKMRRDPSVVAITSGTPTVFGFTAEKRERAGKQFVDVGIAEEHAVALASGIAKNGGKPVYGVYSTFLQRTYDQLAQDVCINRSPVTFLVFAASVWGMNGVTHLGLFDLPLAANIPNLVYLAPTCREEYFAMADWAIGQSEYPVAIRVPAGAVLTSGRAVRTDYGAIDKYEPTKRGKDVAVIALGDFYPLGEEVAAKLGATLINPLYASGVDGELLASLKADHRVVVTLEDGVLDGGFGEKIARFYGNSAMRVLNYGFKKEFVDGYDADELMRANRLTPAQIIEDVGKITE